MKRKVKGFTLIELMVVITIIGVLAALLLPAVFGVQEKANIAVCSSNLKNICIAVHDYYIGKGRKRYYPGVKDSGDTVLGNNLLSSTAGGRFIECLYVGRNPVMKTTEILICPTVAALYVPNPWDQATQDALTSPGIGFDVGTTAYLFRNTEGSDNYLLRPGSDASSTPVAADRWGNHAGSHNIVFLDNHIDFFDDEAGTFEYSTADDTTSGMKTSGGSETDDVLVD